MSPFVHRAPATEKQEADGILFFPIVWEVLLALIYAGLSAARGMSTTRGVGVRFSWMGQNLADPESAAHVDMFRPPPRLAHVLTPADGGACCWQAMILEQFQRAVLAVPAAHLRVGPVMGHLESSQFLWEQLCLQATQPRHRQA